MYVSKVISALTDHHVKTFTGSILVSVNPYQPLPIYRPEDVQRYIGRQIGDMPPHLFAIAEDTYTSLRRYHKDQAILIAGQAMATDSPDLFSKSSMDLVGFQMSKHAGEVAMKEAKSLGYSPV